MGDVVLQAFLSFTPGMPWAQHWGRGSKILLEQRLKGQNSTKGDLEWAAASLDDASHSLKGTKEKLLLCHGRGCRRVRIQP